ncbi:Quinone oxidoreductase 2 [Microbacterium lemovicicum]|uniref:Quinone oxidoreductase 2 n=1 Tax=Microbacterium lemovicicum TaxID=1072463 RepID=A0A3Q9J591_9MICO|nr:NmrA family NAD(P)-binding protein [Microbacterium lemovicicum]AZS38098.1 Quinone oxidoreductase 2 [Microbacterium lemovicicum]
MIVITGAGGRLGRAVVDALLERADPASIGVSTTRPEAAAALAERGVRVRRGDYDDPSSLVDAFADADRVLVVSAPRIGPAALEAHRVALDAARTAGVSRVFYTSHVGADALSPFPPAVTHAATEVMLRDSGLPFTALRNGFYADTALRMATTAASGGELRAPRDAPVSWTFHRDLGPGIAALLLDETLELPAVNLTAGEAFDMAALAAATSGILGREIRHTVIDDEDHAAELTRGGAPEMAARMSIGLFQAARQRHFGIVDPTLADVLGRPTTSLRDVLAVSLAEAEAEAAAQGAAA